MDTSIKVMKMPKKTDADFKDPFERIQKIQEELKDSPLTEEEILREVKAVRKSRAARAKAATAGTSPVPQRDE